MTLDTVTTVLPVGVIFGVPIFNIRLKEDTKPSILTYNKENNASFGSSTLLSSRTPSLLVEDPVVGDPLPPRRPPFFEESRLRLLRFPLHCRCSDNVLLVRVMREPGPITPLKRKIQ